MPAYIYDVRDKASNVSHIKIWYTLDIIWNMIHTYILYDTLIHATYYMIHCCISYDVIYKYVSYQMMSSTNMSWYHIQTRQALRIIWYTLTYYMIHCCILYDTLRTLYNITYRHYILYETLHIIPQALHYTHDMMSETKRVMSLIYRYDTLEISYDTLLHIIRYHVCIQTS